MKCCSTQQCEGLENFFDTGIASGDLEAYRKHGVSGMTQDLITFLRGQGVKGASLLDIGGGVGAIQHELVKAGVATVTGVDASTAYLAAARQEAERQGYQGEYHYGNFVDLAEHIAAADIVTLDRVICCFPDVQGLVQTSSARAVRFYGVIFPRDALWIRTLGMFLNLFMRVRGSKYRFYVHPTTQVDAIAQNNGLRQVEHRRGLVWQMMIYARTAQPDSA